MTRIAILVAAHDEPVYLTRLVRHLTTSFSVYVHLDSASPLRQENLPQHPRLTLVASRRVRWGHLSMVEMMLDLHRAAYRNEHDRYLLISGKDVPIKTNHEIAAFFENEEREYVETIALPNPAWPDGGRRRIDRYHAYVPPARAVGRARMLYRARNWLVGNLTPARPMDRSFYFGSAWVNLSHAGVGALLQRVDEDPSLMQRFRHTFLPEEAFIQTALMETARRDFVVSNDLRDVRFVGSSPHPETLALDDFARLQASSALFARKVAPRSDGGLTDRVMRELAAEGSTPAG